MSELLKAFDCYGDFQRDLYFTVKYDTFGSCLEFDTPLKRTKEHTTAVLELLNLSKDEYQLVHKNWATKDESTAKVEEDTPYSYLFVGINRKVMISIRHWDENLEIEFLYDLEEEDTEAWIIQMNDKLRKKFGQSKSPTFEVLTKLNNCFNTQEVRTEKLSLDLVQHYNDDFKEIYTRIDGAITAKKSGLIMLYGKPGTGKTTYIKSLIGKYEEIDFIFIQNEFVGSLLDPDFISFLLRKRNAVLVIEDAEKVITSREQGSRDSVVSTILQLTDGLFSDYLNIKVICTFNTSLEKIDTALLRKGRMIAMYEFDKLSLEKTNQLLTSLKAGVSYEPLTIADIYNFKERSFSETSKRKIGF